MQQKLHAPTWPYNARAHAHTPVHTGTRTHTRAHTHTRTRARARPRAHARAHVFFGAEARVGTRMGTPVGTGTTDWLLIIRRNSQDIFTEIRQKKLSFVRHFFPGARKFGDWFWDILSWILRILLVKSSAHLFHVKRIYNKRTPVHYIYKCP